MAQVHAGGEHRGGGGERMEGRKTEREEKGLDVMGPGRKNTSKLKSKIHREYIYGERVCGTHLEMPLEPSG